MPRNNHLSKSTPLLTIFTAPKPFTDVHIDVIQRNAIQSWMNLDDAVDVLLVGDEEGLSKVATQYKIGNIPHVERNEQGTPLVSSIFQEARDVTSSHLLAYVNADVILLPDFVRAAVEVNEQLERFLVIGQRWDLMVQQQIEFSEGWDARIRSRVNAEGRLHAPAGSDYFIFPRSLFTELPDFAIGRAGWDNWMIYHAKQQGWKIVDATPSLMAVHQEHGYAHLPDGKPHYGLRESSRNEAIAGGSQNLYMVLDSDKQLINGRVCAPIPSLVRALRRFEVWLTPQSGLRSGVRWSLARKFRRLRRKVSGSL